MKRELFAHQKEGIKFLKKTKRVILADEMGLGKTRQAIIAAGEESKTGILVICPASLKINWKREIGMVYPDDEVLVIESGPEQEIDLPVWVIINYDMLPKYADQVLKLIADGKIETAIIDEAHYIKGKSTLRSEATLQVVKELDKVYCLTGTPIMNRPIELFNILKAIRHPLSKARVVYSKRYCGYQLKALVMDLSSGKRFFVDPKKTFAFRAQKHKYKVMVFGDDTGATRLPELRENISEVFLRREKKEVLDLPEKIISVRVCEIDGDWRRSYDEAWDRYIEWVTSNPEGKNIENILSSQQLVELGKLKQVCSHSKVEQIAEDVKNAVDSGEKVIIFSQYTETIKNLTNAIGLEIKCVTLTGQDDMDDRQKAIDAFQSDPETKVFIANIKAGGVGVNLTAASIVIFADMEWSPEIHRQAEDRAHRIGQGGTVNVYYYVVKDTIEEDIVDILGQKKNIIDEVMKGGPSAGSTSIGHDFMERMRAKLGTTS